MSRYQAISFCGHCATRHSFERSTCPACESRLVVWNTTYESQDEAVRKWQRQNASFRRSAAKRKTSRPSSTPPLRTPHEIVTAV